MPEKWASCQILAESRSLGGRKLQGCEDSERLRVFLGAVSRGLRSYAKAEAEAVGGTKLMSGELRVRDAEKWRVRMSDRRGTESEFELTTIARLEQLGYTYTPGIELDRPPDEVVLRRHLRNFLARRYRDLPDAAIEMAVIHFIRPQGVDTLTVGATWPFTSGWSAATNCRSNSSPGTSPTVWFTPSIGSNRKRTTSSWPTSSRFTGAMTAVPTLFSSSTVYRWRSSN
ncbi:hypothetical protein SBA6_380036 [Candidatus Sulfopaludibacter sp. SbA6]|nr:hypothetical protein SBA6_380036 [Candidatus Sulfopaludibacter sp. SbA6]